MTPCTCRSDPIVLRISLPPGAAPEVVAALVQRAVAAYWQRRRDDDFPRAMSRAEQAVAAKGLIDEWQREHTA